MPPDALLDDRAAVRATTRRLAAPAVVAAARRYVSRSPAIAARRPPAWRAPTRSASSPAASRRRAADSLAATARSRRSPPTARSTPTTRPLATPTPTPPPSCAATASHASTPPGSTSPPSATDRRPGPGRPRRRTRLDADRDARRHARRGAAPRARHTADRPRRPARLGAARDQRRALARRAGLADQHQRRHRRPGAADPDRFDAADLRSWQIASPSWLALADEQLAPVERVERPVGVLVVPAALRDGWQLVPVLSLDAVRAHRRARRPARARPARRDAAARRDSTPCSSASTSTRCTPAGANALDSGRRLGEELTRALERPCTPGAPRDARDRWGRLLVSRATHTGPDGTRRGELHLRVLTFAGRGFTPAPARLARRATSTRSRAPAWTSARPSRPPSTAACRCCSPARPPSTSATRSASGA